MATAREILEECLLRGCFDLKARFLRRGVDVPPRVGDHPRHRFNLTFLQNSTSCKAEVRRRSHAMPPKRRLARFGRRALWEVAGAKRIKKSLGKGRDRLAGDPRLVGAYLAMDRSLHVLGIMGPGCKGFQVYAECCLQFYERHARLRALPAAKDVIYVAMQVVAEKTGRDPCDPANWAAPEDADWEQVIAVSQMLWALLGPESDPYNAWDLE